MEMSHSLTNPLLTQVLDQLQHNSKNISLEFNQLCISNQQIFNKTIRLSNKLAEAGIRPQMPVGVLLERSPEVLICLLALWRLGAIYIPLDPEFPKERLESISNDVRPAAIITQLALQSKLNCVTAKQIILNPFKFSEIDSEPSSINGNNNVYQIQQNDIAYIIYTSGSSGCPKGVEISHAALTSLFSSIIPLLELQADDIFIGLASFSFDISFFELLAPFLVGGKLILLDKKNSKNPAAINVAIDDKKINVIQATPSLWSLLDTGKQFMPTRNITAIATGEALPTKTAIEILKFSNVLWNLYGPTECTIWSSAKKLCKQTTFNTKSGCISIGHALPAYKIILRDKSGQLITIKNQKGELCIGGKGLALAYHNNSSLSTEKFQQLSFNNQAPEQFYLSGDICSWNDNEELIFHGRLDNQVKFNGYRIELEEIEAALERHPSIHQALVSIKQLKHSPVGILFSLIAYKPGMPNKTAANLTSFLQENLAHYMLPQRYFFIDCIPLTVNGKKDRKGLSKHNIFENSSFEFSATTSLEKSIARIFCDVLELKEIGLYESFFDAGGNSMLTASLLMALNNHFNSKISLQEMLLTPPTVHSTSKLINQLDAA